MLLAAMLSMGCWVQRVLGLVPEVRGQRSQAGGSAHQAQALMLVQGPTPPRQLSTQVLDLLPKGMVVFL